LSSHFYEDKNADLNNLRPGAIVVWSQYTGGEHGHICIVDGQGNEYSDHQANFNNDKWYYLNRGATYRVFYPKD
jgi:hypothetical protein